MATDREDKERIKRIQELVEKDHKMIKKLHSAMQWGRVLKILYWVVIIGVAVGAFYFLQPFFEQLMDTYRGLQDSIDNVRSVLPTAQ